MKKIIILSFTAITLALATGCKEQTAPPPVIAAPPAAQPVVPAPMEAELRAVIIKHVRADVTVKEVRTQPVSLTADEAILAFDVTGEFSEALYEPARALDWLAAHGLADLHEKLAKGDRLPDPHRGTLARHTLKLKVPSEVTLVQVKTAAQTKYSFPGRVTLRREGGKWVEGEVTARSKEMDYGRKFAELGDLVVDIASPAADKFAADWQALSKTADQAIADHKAQLEREFRELKAELAALFSQRKALNGAAEQSSVGTLPLVLSLRTDADGNLSGSIRWLTLGATKKLTGKIIEDTLQFNETGVLELPDQSLVFTNLVYHLKYEGQPGKRILTGSWANPVGSEKGPISMDLTTLRADALTEQRELAQAKFEAEGPAQLSAAFASPKAYSGMATHEQERFPLRFNLSIDPHSKEISGTVAWPVQKAVKMVRGVQSGLVLSFSETGFAPDGQGEILGGLADVKYELHLRPDGTMQGKWKSGYMYEGKISLPLK